MAQDALTIFTEDFSHEIREEVNSSRNRICAVIIVLTVALILLIGWGLHHMINALYFDPAGIMTQQYKDTLGLLVVIGIGLFSGITVGGLVSIALATQTAKAIADNVEMFHRGAGHVSGTLYDVYAKGKKKGGRFPFLHALSDQWERWFPS